MGSMEGGGTDSGLQEGTLAVTLSVSQLRQVIRQEFQAAVEQDSSGTERLLNAEETSQRLGVSVDWLYRNARKLPFMLDFTLGTHPISTKGTTELGRSEATKRF